MIKIKTMLAFVVASQLGLVGCGNMSQRHGTAGAPVEQGGNTYAQGVSTGNGFNSLSASREIKLKAPHNQIYHYSLNSSSVDEIDQESAAAQAKYLKANPQARVFVSGHTDERGSREYNVALGERRHKSISDILKVHGVNSNQIREVSYGHEKPVSQGNNENAWGQNRRVEFIYEELG